MRAARFPARKTLEEFDYDHQRSLKREVILHLGTLDFVAAKGNIVFLGPSVAQTMAGLTPESAQPGSP